MKPPINTLRCVVGLPNLLIVGAQKSGTTSLATALAQHNRIYMPPEKELNFFSRADWSDNLYSYLKKFKNRRDTDYWIDATPGYFWTRTYFRDAMGKPAAERHDIPKAIKAALGPHVRIVVILRHPVKRAVSAFFHHFRMARLGTEDRIRSIGDRNGILDLGFYSEHLANYRQHFSSEQIRVIFFEEYMKDPAAVHRDLFDWLGLDATDTTPSSENSNEGFQLDYSPDRIAVQDGIAQLRVLSSHPYYKRMQLVEPPIVEEADIAFLNNIYHDELNEMARLYPMTRSIWNPNLTLPTYRN
ncbi:sulfotransferase family protein [Paracoccus sanguinis]|uniref:sulfotransferase family protein n=1 Tax=Paracoccus sanguinis TaxID=1545044 RepID=UPI0009DF3698|nr:sulfotransferase [Paracoccus sanguinis]